MKRKDRRVPNPWPKNTRIPSAWLFIDPEALRLMVKARRFVERTISYDDGGIDSAHFSAGVRITHWFETGPNEAYEKRVGIAMGEMIYSPYDPRVFIAVVEEADDGRRDVSILFPDVADPEKIRIAMEGVRLPAPWPRIRVRRPRQET